MQQVFEWNKCSVETKQYCIALDIGRHPTKAVAAKKDLIFYPKLCLLVQHICNEMNNYFKGPFSSLMQRGCLFFFSNRPFVQLRTLIGYLFLSGCIFDGKLITHSKLRARCLACFVCHIVLVILEIGIGYSWKWMNPLTTMNSSNEMFTGR